MYDSVDIAKKVVDHCMLVATQVCVIGDYADEVKLYTDILDQKNISYLIPDDVSDLPMFSAVLLLKVNNPDQRFQYIKIQDSFSTAIDVHNLYTDIIFSADSNAIEYITVKNGNFVHRNPVADSPPKEHSFFTPRLKEVFKDLRQTSDSIYTVYAGASMEYRLDMIPFDKTIQKVRNILGEGYNRIIFWNGDETLQSHSILACQRIIEFLKHEVPKDTFYYFTSGLDASQSYRQLCVQYGFDCRLHILTGASFELVTRSNFDGDERRRELADLFKPYNTGAREKKFVCFNRVPRAHRLEFLAHMLEHNLVEEGFYSFDLTEEPYHTTEHVQKQLDKHRHRFPMVLNRTAERDNPVEIQQDDLKYFQKSYFSIVGETLFYKKITEYRPNSLSTYGNLFLSEKMFKPFAVKHPFVVLNFPGSLAAVRQLGFRTFSPWIDETYDTIEDDEERLLAVFAEVQRLCNQTEQQWLEWQQGVRDIVEHNFRWLLEDKDLGYDKQALKYFNME